MQHVLLLVTLALLAGCQSAHRDLDLTALAKSGRKSASVFIVLEKGTYTLTNGYATPDEEDPPEYVRIRGNGARIQVPNIMEVLRVVGAASFEIEGVHFIAIERSHSAFISLVNVENVRIKKCKFDGRELGVQASGSFNEMNILSCYFNDCRLAAASLAGVRRLFFASNTVMNCGADLVIASGGQAFISDNIFRNNIGHYQKHSLREPAP